MLPGIFCVPAVFFRACLPKVNQLRVWNPLRPSGFQALLCPLAVKSLPNVYHVHFLRLFSLYFGRSLRMWNFFVLLFKT